VRSHLLKRRLARWALPPATLAAIASFAAHEVDPAAAAEGAYLGRLAAAALVAVAALAPPPAAELGLGAALATAAVWALPAGPGRGAAVMALLTASLAIAAGRRLRRMAIPADEDAGAGRARLAAAVALCFGCQVLLRGELLFAPGRAVRPWIALLILPVAAGAALAQLWGRRGMLPALAAGAAAAVLAPGWTVMSTLALVALAGGDSLLRAGAPQTAMRSWPDRVRLTAGVAALLLPVAWEPRAGWAAALAGLALWRPGLVAVVALPLAALARGAALAGIGLPGALAAHASWREGAAGLAWLVILVPAALTAAWRPRSRALLAAAALLAFAAPWLPDRSALAATVALAALALPATGAAAGIAAVWSAAVLLGTALLASYPWLRVDPLGDAIALLGIVAGSRLAVAIGGAALLMAGAVELALRRSATTAGPSELAPARATRIAAAVAGMVLFAALVGPQLASPGSALLGGGDAVLLDRAHPSWHVDLGPGRSRGLVMQTHLIHAADLDGGTPVARVRLLGTGSAPLELQLRAGEETGEWAARRPDVAATARLRAPRPWLAWVAGDFFGQRYRARLPLPRAGSFVRIEVDLAAALPPDTGLAIDQVELEP